jgi:hypothetical protein
VHLVGYFHSCITMHGFMNIKWPVLLLPVRRIRHTGTALTLTHQMNIINSEFVKNFE